MHCGCPLPGDTIGQRLTRLKRRLSNASNTSNGLIPPHRVDALSATHASEHNSVLVPDHKLLTESQRKKRAEKVRKRRERDEKNVRERKMDESALRRGRDHDAAFLYPVPFYAYTPVGGCVAYGGIGAGGLGGGFASCAVVSVLCTLSFFLFGSTDRRFV